MRYQSVQMISKRLKYFPDVFVYVNLTLKVVSIERTQTSHQQLSFIIKAEDGNKYELVQTLKSDTWTGKKL